MDMQTRKIKEVVTQMIEDGELQFIIELNRDTEYENWNDDIKIKVKLTVLDFVDNELTQSSDVIYLKK